MSNTPKSDAEKAAEAQAEAAKAAAAAGPATAPPAPLPPQIILQQAPAPALVVAVKGADDGGHFIVGGIAVDAHGQPIQGEAE